MKQATANISHQSYRTFVAIPIDIITTKKIFNQLEIIKQHFGQPNWRWLTADKWHLTIAFLDNQPKQKIEQLHEKLLTKLAKQQVFNLTLIATTGFPPQKPRCVAILPDLSPQLTKLHKTVATCCKSCQISLEKRKFSPHITLARQRLPRVGKLSDYLLVPTIDLTVESLIIYRSELSSAGVDYTPVEVIELVQK